MPDTILHDDTDVFLADFMGGDLLPAMPARQPIAPMVPLCHTERCPSCGGSGRFTSYAGRDCGPCYKCAGKGSKSFKTSATVRANARASAAERTARQAAGHADAFKADHPAEHAWLIQASAQGFAFAVSILAALAKYGSLTERQLLAVQSATAKAANRATESAARVENAPAISAEPIEQAFQKARENGLKRIKVRLAAFTFKPASATSRNAGSIYCLIDQEYLGKISAGRFIGSRACSAELERQIIAVCADPKAAAIAYGKETGSCACCGRELSDPISIANGIGPICASKFGF